MRHRKEIPILKAICIFPLIRLWREVVFASEILSFEFLYWIIPFIHKTRFSFVNIQAEIQFDGTIIVGTIILSHTCYHILIVDIQGRGIWHSLKSIDTRREKLRHLSVVPYLQHHLIVHLRILRFMYSMKLYS